MRNLILLAIAVCLFGCVDSDIRRTPPISQKGQVSILTLNVAGLPDFLTSQDYPKERMYGISHYANAYDVVAYQEDFYYSAALDRHSRFANSERATKWNSWGLVWPWLRKSGLTVQSPWKFSEEKFQAFTDCKGYLKNGNDCWVPKGVLCARTTLPSSVIMDVCITHFDAGGGDEVWRSQASEYMEFVQNLWQRRQSDPYLLVELGDYNMRPHEEVMQTLTAGKEIVISERFGQENFVEVNEVDYIMITSNEHLNVTLLKGGTAKEFTSWSDHLAVFALLGLEIVR